MRLAVAASSRRTGLPSALYPRGPAGMFRRSLLPRACLTLALGLTLSHPLAWGQERSPYERLDRLERDLNMLQRHVYRGATVSTYAPDGATASVNTQLRMDRLEAEMRELTGRVE